MLSARRLCCLQVSVSILCFLCVGPLAHGQSARPQSSQTSTRNNNTAYEKARNDWFYRGRIVRGRLSKESSAELHRRAYEAKIAMRAQHAAALASARADPSPSSNSPWIPLGPVPLASDASGNGTQNYNQVSGRATAVAIDPADPSGNTIYIGGAQAGVWKSTNAANTTANNVTWTALTDEQATLSIGALAIQPGNTSPANTLIIAATGEANNSADSYFGLGILRSTNAGSSWTLVSSANGGTLSFSGLGGTRMAFSTASGQTNTVVSAMATTSEGLVDGAITGTTTRGLYTSIDAGQTWTYDALTDSGAATDATSATSVVYNATAGLFFAAIRYHGFYSSPDGVNWTRLAAQPGGPVLSTSACPPQSTSNSYACPIYRGEITVVPGRSEMYVWYVSLSAGEPVDGGIWQSLDGGSSWNPVSDAGIINCGDVFGCGVEQGTYNLELQAVPDGAGTDLYAGAINLYKCSINSQNPSCASTPFLNLTHAYGCDPIAAPAHVHPAQHALAFIIPTSGNDLMYFANDGGIYRALDGFTDLTTGSCSGADQFDDLNQNLGSMTQFVTFSQHPTDPNTLLAGAQGNGSPATGAATTSLAWGNVFGGDGAYNAIDPNLPLNFYVSNPDLPPNDLAIQLCPDGVSCDESSFDTVVASSDVGGDDGAFNFPYILDSQSPTAMLVGTCRVWRGPRAGGAYAVLSPNFDTLGSGTCAGTEVNLVQALAAGGPTDSNGSLVIYATTSGDGPLNGSLSSPAGGNVWVTANATAGPTSFTNITNNGPQGNINPNQFPISNVAMDASDGSGGTAYVTVMGFTAAPGSTSAPGHVWKTTDFGASWTDYTANLPDSPANSAVIDSVNGKVYVGTDVGVFVSPTTSANWTEVGPASGPSGFLPNTAVTALALFNSGGEEFLRASTYGRGIWEYPITATANYQLSVSNSPLTDFAGQNGAFNGSAGSTNGYNSTVTLTCFAGATRPPSTCTITPSTLTPGNGVNFIVSVNGAVNNYSFDIKGVGSDPRHITEFIPVALSIVSFSLTTPAPSSVTVPRGTNSPAVDFEVTSAGSFSQSVTVSCSVPITNAVCTLTPGSIVYPSPSTPVNMTASVSVPTGTPTGDYTVTLQASTNGAPATLSTDFTLNVTTNPNFVLGESSAFPEINAGSTGSTGPISITSQDGFTGPVALSCSSTFGANSCSITPTSVTSFPATVTLTINGSSFAAGNYSLTITGTSGSITNTLSVLFNVGDYQISPATQALTLTPGAQGVANFMLTGVDFYSGLISITCNASLSGSQCVTPANPVTLATDGSASFSVSINVPNNAAAGNYTVNISTQDSTGNPTNSAAVALTVQQDFIVSAVPPNQSQSVNPGQTTGAYNLSVQPVGAEFSAAVTLACSGLPALAECVFDPSGAITPGTSAQSVVMTISTSATGAASEAVLRRTAIQKNTSRLPRFYRYQIWLLFPGVVIGVCISNRRNRKRAALGIGTITILLLLGLPSCAGVSSGGGGGSGDGTPPGSYTITVTGTSGALSHQTKVILVVNVPTA